MNPLESLALNLWLIYHIQIFLTTSISTTLLSFLKPPGTIFSLYQSIWSTSTFELAKSVFSAKLDVSTPVAPIKSSFIA